MDNCLEICLFSDEESVSQAWLFYCDFCDKSFNTRQKLRHHLDLHVCCGQACESCSGTSVTKRIPHTSAEYCHQSNNMKKHSFGGVFKGRNLGQRKRMPDDTNTSGKEAAHFSKRRKSNKESPKHSDSNHKKTSPHAAKARTINEQSSTVLKKASRETVLEDNHEETSSSLKLRVKRVSVTQRFSASEISPKNAANGIAFEDPLEISGNCYVETPPHTLRARTKDDQCIDFNLSTKSTSHESIFEASCLISSQHLEKTPPSKQKQKIVSVTKNFDVSDISPKSPNESSFEDNHELSIEPMRISSAYYLVGDVTVDEEASEFKVSPKSISHETILEDPLQLSGHCDQETSPTKQRLKSKSDTNAFNASVVSPKSASSGHIFKREPSLLVSPIASSSSCHLTGNVAADEFYDFKISSGLATNGRVCEDTTGVLESFKEKDSSSNQEDTKVTISENSSNSELLPNNTSEILNGNPPKPTSYEGENSSISKKKSQKKTTAKLFSIFEKTPRKSTSRKICEEPREESKHQDKVSPSKRKSLGNHLYFCFYCDKSFSHKPLLERHEKSHESGSKKKFVCKDCNAEFSTRFNLLRHEMLHLPTKMFQCDICEKKFAHLYYLNVHLASHSNICRHYCKFCDSVYKTRYGLTKHQQRVHEDEIS